MPLLQYDPTKLLLSPTKKSDEDATEKDDDDVGDSSGEVTMSDASDVILSSTLNSSGAVTMGTANDSTFEGLHTLSSIATPETHGNQATAVTTNPRSSRAPGGSGDSTIDDSTSMVIDTDTDENSFTL